MKTLHKSGILFFLATLLLILIAIRTASPPSLPQGTISDTAFSSERAYVHLSTVCKLPHSIGTAENERVREYIVAICKELGFTTEIQSTTAVNRFGSFVDAAFVHNIVAYKKGQHNSKSVILMAHYDSQPNTPGAGDDGVGVASMLETARALQKNKSLDNDLVLLFTDGEENGLNGALAFVNESTLVKGMGLILNFEGRGNSGVSNMFEVNPENGWVVNEYAKSVAHPNANSLGYEVYKHLPNNTDYTIFKRAGITGLNNAYIEGFVNYHSMTDKPESFNRQTLQSHGENMLSLVKHFGNLSITNTKSPDLSYFNVFGEWFIHYPAKWNWLFVMLTNFLFILFLVVGSKDKKIRLKGFVISLFAFPMIAAVIFFAAKFLLQGVLSWYPMYTHFYANNSYNSTWYFTAVTVMASGIFALLYIPLVKHFSLASLTAGITLLLLLSMNVMQWVIPTASYVLFVPLIFMLLSSLLVLLTHIYPENRPTAHGLISFIGTVPAVIFLAPIIYFTFIAFSLSNEMPSIMILIVFFAGILLPVLYPVLKNKPFVIPVAALVCFAAAMAGGHFTSGYSAENPVQTNIRYTLDADSAKAKWVSEFSTADNWTKHFFTKGWTDTQKITGRKRLMNDAPLVPYAAPVAVVVKDTLVNNTRKLTVHFQPQREGVVSMRIDIADSSRSIYVRINEKEPIPFFKNTEPLKVETIGFNGVTNQGYDVLFDIPVGRKLSITVTDRSIGLPLIKDFSTAYPADVIPGPDSNSNTVRVSKRFVF